MKAKNKNENSQYGAVEIKSIYRKNLIKGLIFALITHFVIISVYLLTSYLNGLKANDNVNKFNLTFDFKDFGKYNYLRDVKTAGVKVIKRLRVFLQILIYLVLFSDFCPLFTVSESVILLLVYYSCFYIVRKLYINQVFYCFFQFIFINRECHFNST